MSCPVLLGLARTAAEDVASDPLLEQPTAASAKTAASRVARTHNLDISEAVTARPKETTRATSGLDSEPSLGVGRGTFDRDRLVAVVVVILDPVEGVILRDRLRLPLGHVGLQQVAPPDEADDDVEQERLDAADEHLEVPVALLMHEMPERLAFLGLELEEPAPEEQVDAQEDEEDQPEPDQEPSIPLLLTRLVVAGPGHGHRKPRRALIV